VTDLSPAKKSKKNRRMKRFMLIKRWLMEHKE